MENVQKAQHTDKWGMLTINFLIQRMLPAGRYNNAELSETAGLYGF